MTLDLDRRPVAHVAAAETLPVTSNRALFVELLDLTLHAPPDGSADQVAALVVEVDHFHRVTARFGDDAGEELMRILARRILKCLPCTALIARLGDDRFAMMVPAGPDEDAEALALAAAAKIQLAVASPPGWRMRRWW